MNNYGKTKLDHVLSFIAINFGEILGNMSVAFIPMFLVRLLVTDQKTILVLWLLIIIIAPLVAKQLKKVI